MSEFSFRRAVAGDLPRILPVYAAARERMRQAGNPHQWGADRPGEDQLRRDIARGQLWLMERGGRLAGVFALICGQDPTYARIDGAWLNQAPYATIHRIASTGEFPGVFPACVDFAWALGLDLRVDTHRDNGIMQHQIERCGFHRCGTIYLADGSARLAYQKARELP